MRRILIIHNPMGISVAEVVLTQAKLQQEFIDVIREPIEIIAPEIDINAITENDARKLYELPYKHKYKRKIYKSPNWNF